MSLSIEEKKSITKVWFQELQDQMISAFESIDNSQFLKKNWERPGGGGGTMAIMKGQVFEKVGVNFSEVYGQFSKEFRQSIPGANENGDFWASGISIVAHMKNPKIPAAHFNTRFITTEQSWFGGGCDLTPAIENKKEALDFHNGLKMVCDNHQYNYEAWKKECDEYFYLHHRKEPRGIGGIFFDNLNYNQFEKEFSFIKDLGIFFKNFVYKNTMEKKNEDYTEEDIKKLFHKRSRYVEFNLLYDRGTLFGLKTNGNVDAILMSMPPRADWS